MLGLVATHNLTEQLRQSPQLTQSPALKPLSTLHPPPRPAPLQSPTVHHGRPPHLVVSYHALGWPLVATTWRHVEVAITSVVGTVRFVGWMLWQLGSFRVHEIVVEERHLRVDQ